MADEVPYTPRYNLYVNSEPLTPRESLADLLKWAHATDNYPMAQFFCFGIYGHDNPELIDPDADPVKYSRFEKEMDPIIDVGIFKIGRPQ